jgi:glyoxylase-like metal-dependent hydrolase (beta-lactamase superfamily II)
MVITATEPVILDIGCLIDRARWIDQVLSIVEPADVRWVFHHHGDRDHIGNLDVFTPQRRAPSILAGIQSLFASLRESRR